MERLMALVAAAVLIAGALALAPVSKSHAQTPSSPEYPTAEPEKGKPKVNTRDHRTPKKTVRDHRAQPEVRDHRAQPEVRDHRVQPTTRDQRATKPAVRTPKQGGVSVRDSAPRDRGSKKKENEPKTPNEIVRDFLGGFGGGRPREPN